MITEAIEHCPVSRLSTFACDKVVLRATRPQRQSVFHVVGAGFGARAFACVVLS